MGAWGTAAFDNDDASDWVYDLEKRGIAAIDDALSGAEGPGALVMPEDVNVLAAGEIIAAALGRPATGLRDDILSLARVLRGDVTPEHVARARVAVESVLADSEVADLWAETDEDGAWRAVVDDLIGRLTVGSSPAP
jgi:hypothetical protein